MFNSEKPWGVCVSGWLHQRLGFVPAGLLLLLGAAIGWWLAGSGRSVPELALAVQVSGIGGIMLGGMIVTGAMSDAWTDGGIVDLNEDPVLARLDRVSAGTRVALGLAVSGATLAGVGLVLGDGWAF